MKRWVDFIIYMDETHCDGKRLWTVGFHFADWLALDNPDPESRFGRTDPYYVASVYYLYSSELDVYKRQVEAHIEQHFGHFSNVFHEIASPDIHVDIAIVEPTPERNYYTLVTMGMGAHRMACLLYTSRCV